MKINISRIFETSKLLATESGKQLQELIQHTADLSEQVLRAMRNQLTFADNFDAIVSEVSVTDQIETVVYTGGKTPTGMFPIKVTSTTVGIDALRWYIDDNNNTKVWIKFTTASVTLNVKLVILFN